MNKFQQQLLDMARRAGAAAYAAQKPCVHPYNVNPGRGRGLFDRRTAAWENGWRAAQRHELNAKPIWTKLSTINAIIGSLAVSWDNTNATNMRRALAKVPHVYLRKMYRELNPDATGVDQLNERDHKFVG